jgi:hypothetical protein
MTSFRSSPTDDELMHRLMLKLNVGSKTELIRLGLQKLDNDTLVVRSYVPAPPTLKQAIATVSMGIETWSLAVKNFYPVDIPGQSLERAAKVQHARELSDHALTEFTPKLRLIRAVAAACTAQIEAKAFDEICSSVRHLQRHIEENRNVLRTAAAGSKEAKAAEKNIRGWASLVDFLISVGFGTPRPVATTTSSPNSSPV